MERPIYYHDTDAGGVVYYGRYCNFLEEARTEFLVSKGLNPAKLAERGFLYAVRRCHLEYKRPARYGDLIRCNARIVRLTAAQIVFEQQVCLAPADDLLVQAEVHLVSLNKDFKPCPIPEDIRRLIAS